jgi:hypothetical protein
MTANDRPVVTRKGHEHGNTAHHRPTSVLYATSEARVGAAASPMATGMEIAFKRLDELLASKQPNPN